MTTKKKIILISVIIAVIGLTIGGVFLGLYLKSVNDYKKRVNEIKIEDIDISKRQDGIYCGSYDVGFIYAEVEVTVISGEITKILLIKHDNDRGAAAEDITQKVMQEQSLQVDIITGATNSSKTILKAIEEALKSQPLPLD